MNFPCFELLARYCNSCASWKTLIERRKLTIFLIQSKTESDLRTGKLRIILTCRYQIEVSGKEIRLGLGGSIGENTGQPVSRKLRTLTENYSNLKQLTAKPVQALKDGISRPIWCQDATH